MQLGPVGGTAYLKINGQQLALAGTFKFKPGGVVREGQVGLSGPVGYTEKPTMPSVEAEIFLTPDIDLKAINGFNNETITFELANGQAYTLSNAFQANEIDADGGEGKTTLIFQGLRMERTR